MALVMPTGGATSAAKGSVFRALSNVQISRASRGQRRGQLASVSTAFHSEIKFPPPLIRTSVDHCELPRMSEDKLEQGLGSILGLPLMARSRQCVVVIAVWRDLRSAKRSLLRP